MPPRPPVVESGLKLGPLVPPSNVWRRAAPRPVGRSCRRATRTTRPSGQCPSRGEGRAQRPRPRSGRRRRRLGVEPTEIETSRPPGGRGPVASRGSRRACGAAGTRSSKTSGDPLGLARSRRSSGVVDRRHAAPRSWRPARLAARRRDLTARRRSGFSPPPPLGSPRRRRSCALPTASRTEPPSDTARRVAPDPTSTAPPLPADDVPLLKASRPLGARGSRVRRRHHDRAAALRRAGAAADAQRPARGAARGASEARARRPRRSTRPLPPTAFAVRAAAPGGRGPRADLDRAAVASSWRCRC